MKTFDETQAIAVTCRTDNDLFKLGMGPYCLYHRYAYHSKIQKTNQIWANNFFMHVDMGVAEKTIKIYKAILKKNGYIEVTRSRNEESGQVGKSFVKINKLLGTNATDKVTIGVKKTPVAIGVITPPDGSMSIKCLKDDKTKCLKDDNTAIDNVSKIATVKATSSIEFLRTPPVDYVEGLSSELEVPKDFIEKERVKCLDWFESKGKRMKNYNAFFRNWIRKSWEELPDWKKVDSNYDANLNGMYFSKEKQKDVWYEGGKIIAEYEDDLQWQTFLRTKGENFVIPEKPTDGIGYQPMSHEQRMKKIESGEIKVWDF